jgi:Glycosyltransferase family 87
MRRRSYLGLLLALLAAFSMWFYVQRILIPHERSEAALHGTPRGNLSDLYPRWLGARELLLHHRNPYNADITREIQSGYYGRLLDPTRTSDPRDEQRFAYPIYVVFLLAPTVGLPFHVVAIGFRWLLLLLTAASVLLWLRALRWKPSCTTIAILMLLTLGSFPAIQGMKLQQLSLLVSAMLAAVAALLATEHLVIAGILLALATIKPQLVFLVVPALFLWVISDWRARKRLARSFAATMLLLVVGSEILLTGWLSQFRAAMSGYYRYTGGGLSLLDVLTGALAGKALAALLIVVLAVLAYRSRQDSSSSTAFIATFATTLAVTIVVIPTFAPYNQLLLLPAVLIVVRDRQILLSSTGLVRSIVAVLAAVVVWPWIASITLLLAAIVLPSTNLQKYWAVPLYTSLAIPPAVLLLLFLRLRHPDHGASLPSAARDLNPHRLP